MNKFCTTLFFIFLITVYSSFSGILKVGAGKTYPNLNSAATVAQPGDTILIFDAVITQSSYITNLKGDSFFPIVISSGLSENILFQGSGTAIQFSDIENVTLTKLSFKDQTANGLNIDDGGTYDTPSHDILIEDCIWYGMDATGNNDCLKMSGVDYFKIRNCQFLKGAAGGSEIDMVGCHRGLIEMNKFSDAGSNCIQAKGGCSMILICRNEFVRGGQRSINIGGSTGMEFFRPLDAEYEAQNIGIYSNIFWGSVAPVAFVGAYGCFVQQNTFINPEKWSIRILQENNNIQLGQCSNNSVVSNIFYFSNAASNPVINIGGNTIPESFFFSNNLWYNYQNPEGDYPNLPSNEFYGITGEDPLFTSLPDSNLTPLPSSPAIGSGSSQLNFQPDFNGKDFDQPITIGAINGNPTTSVQNEIFTGIKIYPQPALNTVTLELGESAVSKISIYDINGNETEKILPEGTSAYTIDLKKYSNGTYFIKLSDSKGKFQILPLNVSK